MKTRRKVKKLSVRLINGWLSAKKETFICGWLSVRSNRDSVAIDDSKCHRNSKANRYIWEHILPLGIFYHNAKMLEQSFNTENFVFIPPKIHWEYLEDHCR